MPQISFFGLIGINNSTFCLLLFLSLKRKTKITGVVKQSTASYEKQKENTILGAYFMPRTTHGAKKFLQNCWKNKEVVERCGLAIAKWIIDACVSFNVANSIYYQHAIDCNRLFFSSSTLKREIDWSIKDLMT
jgi:hypothetical protein